MNENEINTNQNKFVNLLIFFFSFLNLVLITFFTLNIIGSNIHEDHIKKIGNLYLSTDDSVQLNYLKEFSRMPSKLSEVHVSNSDKFFFDIIKENNELIYTYYSEGNTTSQITFFVISTRNSKSLILDYIPDRIKQQKIDENYYYTMYHNATMFIYSYKNMELKLNKTLNNIELSTTYFTTSSEKEGHKVILFSLTKEESNLKFYYYDEKENVLKSILIDNNSDDYKNKFKVELTKSEISNNDSNFIKGRIQMIEYFEIIDQKYQYQNGLLVLTTDSLFLVNQKHEFTKIKLQMNQKKNRRILKCKPYTLEDIITVGFICITDMNELLHIDYSGRTNIINLITGHIDYFKEEQNEKRNLEDIPPIIYEKLFYM